MRLPVPPAASDAPGLAPWLRWAADLTRNLTTKFQTDDAQAQRKGQPVELPSFTVTTLPSPTGRPRMIYVSNEAGGATVAFNDGSNWRRAQDRAVVS